MTKITKIKNNNLKRFGVILCMAIAVTFSLTGCGSNKEPYDKARIISKTKNAVKERLKSPSSAEFCPLHEFQFVESGTDLYVSGYVDAQNSFGAMLRSKFKVTFKYLGAEIDEVYIY